MAHELGHIVYPPRTNHIRYHRVDHWNQLDFSTRDNLTIAVARDELNAMKFATELLISTAEFWEYISKGPYTLSDLLEEFGVPRWFLEYKIGLSGPASIVVFEMAGYCGKDIRRKRDRRGKSQRGS